MAGRRVLSDLELPGLAPFQSSPVAAGGEGLEPPAVASSELVYSGATVLDGVRRRIESRRADGGYLLEVAGAGRFFVGRRQSGMVATRVECPVPSPALGPAALGPVLLFCLALDGVWCLHAGAVLGGRGVVAFVGPSGAGKSTLARQVGLAADGAWRRLADDLLPVALERSRPVALPRYPQLKLEPQAQPAVSAPERLPLAAIYLLETPGAGGPDTVQVESATVAAPAAVAALARGTFISFLLDGRLLARQLEFFVTVAERVPVRRLLYPRRQDVAAEVARRIGRDLG